jgi:hypothetical protein
VIEYGPGHVTYDEQRSRLHESEDCTGRWIMGTFNGTPVVICAACRRDWALESVYGRMALAEVRMTQFLRNPTGAAPGSDTPAP